MQTVLSHYVGIIFWKDHVSSEKSVKGRVVTHAGQDLGAALQALGSMFGSEKLRETAVTSGVAGHQQASGSAGCWEDFLSHFCSSVLF